MILDLLKEEKMLTQAKINRLLKSGNWMIRFDNDGVSYNGFIWGALNKWTNAPDWNKKQKCGNGLHGQSLKGAGHCQAGSRLVLCETREQIVIEGNKVKTPSAKIIAINEEIPAIFIEGLTQVGGSLALRGYQHPLPEGLTQVGGYLDLEGYQHPLPEGLTQVGGSLFLRGYQHPLPEGLTQVGGYLDLRGYQIEL